MDHTRENLAIMIEARNVACKAAVMAKPILVEYFKDWVGMQIATAKGSLIKKVLDSVPDLSFLHDIEGYHQTRCSLSYCFGYVFKSCVVVDGIATYDEVDILIGFVEDGVLIELKDREEDMGEYSLDAILAAGAKLKKAEEDMREAQRELCNFPDWVARL